MPSGLSGPWRQELRLGLLRHVRPLAVPSLKPVPPVARFGRLPPFAAAGLRPGLLVSRLPVPRELPRAVLALVPPLRWHHSSATRPPLLPLLCRLSLLPVLPRPLPVCHCIPLDPCRSRHASANA